MSIYTKLFEIQKKNVLLKADAENPFYKSKYVSIENIMLTLKPLLEEQGLLIVHSIDKDCVKTSIVEIPQKEEVETSIFSSFPINNQLDAQKIGAMVTYWKRYNLVALFALIEEDDDGNTLVNNAPQTSQKTPSATTPPKKEYNTPKGQKLFIEYINEIKTISDTNELQSIADECKALYKSEKQIAWIDKDVQARKDFLKNMPF